MMIIYRLMTKMARWFRRPAATVPNYFRNEKRRRRLG